MFRWLAGLFRSRDGASPPGTADAGGAPDKDPPRPAVHDPMDGHAMPEVVDESSDEAWDRWQEALAASDRWDSETQPLELRPDRKDD